VIDFLIIARSLSLLIRLNFPQVTVSGGIIRSSACLYTTERVRANKSERRESEKREWLLLGQAVQREA